MDEPSGTQGVPKSLAAGAITGRELLARELERLGVPNGPEAVTRIVISLATDVPAPTGSSVSELSTAIDAAIPQAIDLIDGAQQVIDDALRIVDDGVEARASVADAAHLIWSAAGALTLLLVVAKARLNIDFRTGDFTFGLDGGVPKGFRDVANALVKLVGAELRLRKEPSEGPTNGDGPAAPSVSTSVHPSSGLPLNQRVPGDADKPCAFRDRN